MRKLRLVLSAAALVAIMLPMTAPPAQATHVFDQDMTVWSAQGCGTIGLDNRCTYPQALFVGLDDSKGNEGTTEYWTSNQRAAVLAAMDEINDEILARGPSWSGAQMPPVLLPSGWQNGTGTQGTEDTSSLCGQDSQITITKYNGAQQGAEVEGEEYDWPPFLCGQGTSTDQIYRSHIVVADWQSDQNDAWDHDGQDESGYWGASVPEPVYRQGMRGILVHELLHALGFQEHWEGMYHGDTDATPYCLNDADVVPNNDGLPAPDGTSAYKTMCTAIYNGWGDGVYQPFSNYFYTLAGKDVQMINDDYAQRFNG